MAKECIKCGNHTLTTRKSELGLKLIHECSTCDYKVTMNSDEGDAVNFVRNSFIGGAALLALWKLMDGGES